MAKIKGICRNVDGCDMAADKVVQEKEKTEFVCEECGKPLYPVEDKKKKINGNKKIVFICLGVLALAGIVIALISLLTGKSNDIQEVLTPNDTLIAKTDTVKPVDKDTIPVVSVKTDTIIVRDTIVQNNTTTISEKTSTKTVVSTTSKATKNSGSSSSRTLNLSYGKYTGAVKGGYPHGQGKLTYTTSRQISQYDPKARTANAGEYVIGEFFNGFVVFGKLYDAYGNVLSSLNFGVGPEDAYESK